MASAYAALVSLMNVLHIIKHPKNPVSYPLLDKSQIQSLFDKVNSLVELLETHSKMISRDLETKMTDAAFAAEDTVESYLVEGIKKSRSFSTSSAGKTSGPLISLDLDKAIAKATREIQSLDLDPMLSRGLVSEAVDIQNSTGAAGETSGPLLPLDLDKAIQEMNLIILEAMLQVKLNNDEQDQLHSKGLAPFVNSTAVPRPVKVVGLKEETNRLISQLTSCQSNRQIIPIVGMGGIGKTTLATNVYNHPPLSRRFDVKARVTVSQVYTTRTLITCLLHGIGVHETDRINDEDLGDKLYKGLFGLRYLVIIDDIWDVEAWYEINRFFPENKNGSRIILTTRLSNVAINVGSCSPLELELLDDDQSWDLLSNMVFEQEVSPSELESFGKEIAKNCKGLPLAIVVIGGLLKVSDRTRELWEHVEKNTRSIIGREDNDHCMKILSLSYHQLPIHLKPCFLYLSTFPEDTENRVSEVTKLWVADGFLKPAMDGKTLDEFASECLKDLARRNLVIVKQNRWEEKCLTVHDLVRDLCIKEARNEKFVYVDDGVVSLPNSIELGQRRVVVHENGCISYRGMQQKGLSRSFIWFNSLHSPPEISRLSLLRVLVSSSDWGSLVEYKMQLFNLRFVKLSINKDQLYLLSSICLALNLETLILDGAEGYNLPVEIWKLWRLKHLVVSDGYYTGIILPDPPAGSDFVLENLQTLKGVRVLSDIVLHRIPNIKTMEISYEHVDKMEPPPCFDNLVHCHKLEKLWFGLEIPGSLETNKYPNYLKTLTLNDTKIPWENMTIVGSLPNLEFLDLQWDAFIGEEWNSVEGEFDKLKYLRIYECNDLVRWIVEESSHFPSLEQLKLEYMYKLEEIPLVFGELMTLVSIKIFGCSDVADISARQILEEQQQGGNNDLIVDISDQFGNRKDKP